MTLGYAATVSPLAGSGLLGEGRSQDPLLLFFPRDTLSSGSCAIHGFWDPSIALFTLQHSSHFQEPSLTHVVTVLSAWQVWANTVLWSSLKGAGSGDGNPHSVTTFFPSHPEQHGYIIILANYFWKTGIFRGSPPCAELTHVRWIMLFFSTILEATSRTNGPIGSSPIVEVLMKHWKESLIRECSWRW